MMPKKSMVLAAVIALAPCMAGAQALLTERGISLNAAMKMATATWSGVAPTATK
jgi:hypothetical protein